LLHSPHACSSSVQLHRNWRQKGRPHAAAGWLRVCRAGQLVGSGAHAGLGARGATLPSRPPGCYVRTL
jgi:hypothetical protein